MYVCKCSGTVGTTQIGCSVSDDYVNVIYGKKPEAKKLKVRPSGRSCGSGSYFISMEEPYLPVTKVQAGGEVTIFTDGYVESIVDSWGYHYVKFGNAGQSAEGELFFKDTDIGSTWVGSPAVYYHAEKLSSHEHFYNVGVEYVRFSNNPKNGNKVCYRSIFSVTQADSAAYDFNVAKHEDTVSCIKTILSRMAALTHAKLAISYDGKARYYSYEWAPGKTVNFMTQGVRVYESHVRDVHVDWQFSTDDNMYGDFSSIVDLGIIPGSIRNLVATAYTEATSQLPEVSANSTANVLDIAKTLYGYIHLIRGGRKAITKATDKFLTLEKVDPRTLRKVERVYGDGFYTVNPERFLKDRWLSWRYVYNTTKMDIKEYREITDRLCEIGLNSQFFTINGYAYGDAMRIHCSRKMYAEDYDFSKQPFVQKLKTYGLQLSYYDVWDMVPYSFVVDWFIPVGDAIDMLEKWQDSLRLKSADDWFSCYQTRKHGYTYFRWHNCSPSLPPVYEKRRVGLKTICYRIADSISLFIVR